MKTKEKSSGRIPVWSGFKIGVAEIAKQRRVWLDANEPPPNLPLRRYDIENPDSFAEYFLHVFTWNYVRLNVSVKPTPNSTWRDYAVEAGRVHAMEGLRHLQSLDFTNDQNALRAIAEIAISATETLTGLSNRAPERVRPVARQYFFWPFLKARKERFGDPHKDLVKKIELGAEAPFSEAAATRIRSSNISVRLAMMLLCRLESYRHRNPAVERLMSEQLPIWKDEAMRLEPFCADTWSKWFKVAWEAVLYDYEGHPERDEDLKKLGQYRAKHTFVKNEGVGRMKTTSRTRETDIRNGINEKLKTAIERLAGVKNPTN